MLLFSSSSSLVESVLVAAALFVLSIKKELPLPLNVVVSLVAVDICEVSLGLELSTIFLLLPVIEGRRAASIFSFTWDIGVDPGLALFLDSTATSASHYNIGMWYSLSGKAKSSSKRLGSFSKYPL